MMAAIDFKSSHLEGMNGAQALERVIGPMLKQLIKAYDREAGRRHDDAMSVQVKRQDCDCISLELYRGEAQ